MYLQKMLVPIFYCKIQDQGNGMSKSVQKRVFEKFYREHTGDVHNVKGHGLRFSLCKTNS